MIPLVITMFIFFFSVLILSKLTDKVKDDIFEKKINLLYRKTKTGELKIGDFVEGKGIYAGVVYYENNENPKSLFVAMEDAAKKMNWNEAMAQNYGQYRLPTIRELTQIHLYKDVINAGLTKNGGDELKDDWYWSSTESSATYAWLVNFNNGVRWNYSKYDTNYVRPVLAFYDF